MRIWILSIAAVLLVCPAAVAAAETQGGQYVPGVPATSQALQQATPSQTETETTPTETTPTETTPEEEAPAEPGGDSDGVPQQYTDPLAGQDPDDGGQEQSPEPAATQGVSAVSVSQLPSTGTGAPTQLYALGGLGLLGFGLAMRLLCREREYPYPLPWR
jgi:LPXTG-motif cell wall-anchored protein